MIFYLSRLLRLGLVLIVAILITGCVEGSFHVTLNKDGSADLDYKIGFDKTIMSILALTGEDIVIELRKDAEREGYKVASYTDQRNVGVHLSKRVHSIEEATLDMNGFSFWKAFQTSGNQETSLIREPSIQVRDGFFSTTYRVKGDIDLSGWNIDLNPMFGFGNALSRAIDLQFTVTLPIKPTSHNATNVSDEGHTLTWNLLAGQNNVIELEGKVPNFTKILSLLLIILISSIIGVVYYLYARAKNHS